MNNSEFLAKVIQEKLQNDIDGNIALGVSILPLMENPETNQYKIPVLIGGDKLIITVSPYTSQTEQNS